MRLFFRLFNLQVPTASYVIDGRPALNQCRWHQTGHHIGVGDNNGHIHVFDVGEVN